MDEIRYNEEAMSFCFSVFNGHINDADKKARAYMKRFYPSRLARIEEIERDGGGIMAIFNQSPEDATSFYVGFVCALTNEGLVEKTE